MSIHQGEIWQEFLQPLWGFLIDTDALKKLSSSINWKQECDRIKNTNVTYPEYYQAQNFHGVDGGYLTSSAAVTYDAVTQYVLLPNETWIRQALIENIRVQPKRILDLGCGTGSTTILLKQAFPDAEVIGLDLSPYMLAIAKYKANQTDFEINWFHGLAEATSFADNSFDLVTASLLFHETPKHISQAILRESFRLLTPGGQIIILDGNQKTLRQTPWLTNIFEEPYIQEYAKGNLDAWLGATGFDLVSSDRVWWTNQVSYGFKPLPVQNGFVMSSDRLQLAIGI